ncbi:MAG: methyl-accepting chemotaxis protein [Dehalococcoidales bacterium]|nr:methyl-accepting chemotaxis protein [Dehalococcoidales bacterium]
MKFKLGFKIIGSLLFLAAYFGSLGYVEPLIKLEGLPVSEGLLGIGGIIAIALGIWLTVSITRPLSKLTRAAEAISRGDTDVKLAIKPRHTMGALAGSLRDIAAQTQSAKDTALAVTQGDFSKVNDNTGTEIRNVLAAMKAETATLAQAAAEGKILARIDVTKYKGEYAAILSDVNDMLGTVTGYIDNLSNPVMIVNKEQEILYINKAGARYGNTTPEAIIENQAHCYQYWRTGHCRTAKCACALAMKSGKAETAQTEAHPGGKNIDISYIAVPILNKQGDVIGALESSIDQSLLKQTVRSSEKMTAFFNQEMDRLSNNLRKIAAGNMDCDFQVSEADTDTEAIGASFKNMEETLGLTVKSMANLISDFKKLSESAVEGDLSVRGDVAKHKGDFQKIVKGVNDTLDAVIIPINEAAEVLKKIAENDLSAKMQGDYRGDFARIKTSLNLAIDSLTLMVTKSKESAGNLKDSSTLLIKSASQAGQATTQVASSSQQMARGAQETSQSTQQIANSMSDFAKAIGSVAKSSEEQTRMVEQTAQVVNQVVSAINQVTKNAQEASGSASKSSQATQNAEQMSRRTADAVNSIKESIAVMAKTVNEMSERATQIGKIVETIDDIAAQTNLLALNAAIEAARAGEQGAGFAVVADEVRKLAERTAIATRETADIIGDMQKSVKSAVDGAASADKQAAEGAKLSFESAILLKSVLAEVEKAQAQIEQISAAAEEINASSNEMVKTIDGVSQAAEKNTQTTQEISSNLEKISQSIENVAGISEENSAATEQMSASAQEVNAQIEEIIALSQTLDGMAKDFGALVGKFNLKSVAK